MIVCNYFPVFKTLHIKLCQAFLHNSPGWKCFILNKEKKLLPFCFHVSIGITKFYRWNKKEFPKDLFCAVVPGPRTLIESAGALTRPFFCAESLMMFTLKPFPALDLFSWLTILIKFKGTFSLR